MNLYIQFNDKTTGIIKRVTPIQTIENERISNKTISKQKTECLLFILEKPTPSYKREETEEFLTEKIGIPCIVMYDMMNEHMEEKNE
jgi:hypothetical protein